MISDDERSASLGTGLMGHIRTSASVREDFDELNVVS